MSITFRRAVRENVGLIIGLAGPSGGGKTLSAMRLAKGIAGQRPFAVIDTEAGRAKHYAGDFIFDHADLAAPFRPDAYADAIKAADAAKYPVIVVDSFSHEHAGDGGLLDWHEEELDRMAKDDWKRRESCSLSAWIKPKMSHKQMVQRLLQVRAHVILCFRAEQKIEMVRKDGRMEIQPKKIASGFSDWIPIAEKNILYELTASFLLTPDAPGVPRPIKLQKQMREFVDLDKPLDEMVGQRMAMWASGSSSSGEQRPRGAEIGEPHTRDAATRNQSTEGQGNVKSDARTQNPTNEADIFAQTSAIADHELALDECATREQLKAAWDDVVKDARLTSETRTPLYQRMQKRQKALGVTK